MTKAKGGDRAEETAALKELLLWMRKERISCAHVVIGEVSVQVSIDHKMVHVDTDRKPAEDIRRGIVEEFGGALFGTTPTEVAPSTDAMEPTIEDDDD